MRGLGDRGILRLGQADSFAVQHPARDRSARRSRRSSRGWWRLATNVDFRRSSYDVACAWTSRHRRGGIRIRTTNHGGHAAPDRRHVTGFGRNLLRWQPALIDAGNELLANVDVLLNLLRFHFLFLF